MSNDSHDSAEVLVLNVFISYFTSSFPLKLKAPTVAIALFKKGENGQSGDVICGRLTDKQADTTDDAML